MWRGIGLSKGALGGHGWYALLLQQVVREVLEGKGRGAYIRFGRLWLKLEATVYVRARPRAMKTIRARVTRDTPISSPIISFAMPAMSSGESSLVKASLNVTAAVASSVAIAVDAVWLKRWKPLVASDCRFHK